MPDQDPLRRLHVLQHMLDTVTAELDQAQMHLPARHRGKAAIARRGCQLASDQLGELERNLAKELENAPPGPSASREPRRLVPPYLRLVRPGDCEPEA